MKINNNISWRLTIALCVMLFGGFLLFFLLRTRNSTSQLAIENQDTDKDNMANDWKNIFNDLNVVFNKMTTT